ncbi:MAG: secondary thiamine-phosphate synthase enzyme YjbQ [Humidesulfovibrio sp.]|uniref:secondary thiamine-phosphate synthase enzyme YjbQ n=1 Tax=Humidesulfovibrio sp. TaxID=2910988 RepID=UPI0027347FAA|nr:secondary thiamine-phosphate synthase enzyme YjbQ [Humidesulfovibrio sp.]MDP2847816.1 secondary thiamine-phosphate synthase enzyme YjbQ [Humidesulfovibrio sp.]
MRQFSVATQRSEEFVDITGQVAQALAESGLKEGAVLVYSPHTTAGVTINEGADPDVKRDMLEHLRSLVPNSADFRHAEGNSDAHIKTSLMGPSQLIPVSGGSLLLGTWQKIYLCEFDGPRRRSVLVQALAAGD